ncbi:hypothetical protein FXV83_41870 [Bradyrhizobium hipponense]|uniref:Uncharacterized protein n=1 Tax=Bradyrhizobium hipponense TaxID=2605638 RepID=A0A5S4YAT1_9BRAD|nr:hypothetical protein [Bradyrhizobium hipponense]TYO60794.1 hypothetical protein FXV83_41870 [Bradyrhizobium hipponense]
MTHTKFTAGDLASLFNWSLIRLHELACADELPIVVSESFRPFSHQDQFSYSDALMVEVARQMHDDGGISILAASKLVLNAGIGAPREDGADHWIAIVRYRNTWGDSNPRGSIPVTEIGHDEYWSSSHFAGSLGEVTSAITAEIGRSAKEHPGSDPARIFLANVSTADRRLRNRAAALGLKIASLG